MNSQMERGTQPVPSVGASVSGELGGVTQLMYQCVHPTWELSEAHTIGIFMEASSPGIAVVQLPSRVLLYDPMDCSMPSFPVHHQFPELAQTHVQLIR